MCCSQYQTNPKVREPKKLVLRIFLSAQLFIDYLFKMPSQGHHDFPEQVNGGQNKISYQTSSHSFQASFYSSHTSVHLWTIDNKWEINLTLYLDILIQLISCSLQDSVTKLQSIQFCTRQVAYDPIVDVAVVLIPNYINLR